MDTYQIFFDFDENMGARSFFRPFLGRPEGQKHRAPTRQ